MISQEKLDKVKLRINKHNQYEFVENETRNCLLCGRTGSGKTTTIGVLKDPFYTPQSTSIFSETPKFQSFSINNRQETTAQKFTINTIDCPGLFGVDRERTDEVIGKMITKSLQNQITNINSVIMFVNFESGINGDEIESIKLFLDLFGGSGVPLCLCVSHAEKQSYDWCDKIRDNLINHEQLSSLIKKEKMSIMFMGCVGDVKNYKSSGDLEDDLVSVSEMRKKFLDFIFASREKTMLNQMNIAKKKIDAVSTVMDLIINNFKLFTITNDFSTSKLQESIKLHRENITYLSENSIYMNLPQLADKFMELFTAANQFKSHDVDKQLKNSLLWPLKLRD